MRKNSPTDGETDRQTEEGEMFGFSLRHPRPEKCLALFLVVLSLFFQIDDHQVTIDSLSICLTVSMFESSGLSLLREFLILSLFPLSLPFSRPRSLTLSLSLCVFVSRLQARASSSRVHENHSSATNVSKQTMETCYMASESNTSE